MKGRREAWVLSFLAFGIAGPRHLVALCPSLQLPPPPNPKLCACLSAPSAREIEPRRCWVCGMRHAPSQHEGMGGHAGHAAMTGMYGNYPVTRDASGTAWQPDSTPHRGLHFMTQDWMMMLHGQAQVVYDDQAGARGGEKTFSSNMLMVMATRPAGQGRLGLRAMVSAEPLTIGRQGYPLLLQTGETADGRAPLIDRQHPHDLLMELAVTYSYPLSVSSSFFAYFGLPGEPALGPPAFIHRFSGEEIPAAPISHHWVDSTHVTFGVATLGFVRGKAKFEGSVFTGREPDERRFDFDRPRFDSYSFRLSYNPTPDWALQGSFGHIRSREELEPKVNTDRVTMSVIYNKNWGQNTWQSLFAWGRNIDRPKGTTDAFLLESTLAFREKHTVFARADRADKDDLLPQASQTFTVGQVSFGYMYDFLRAPHWVAGLGGLASVGLVPEALKVAYGGTPLSGMAFLRIKLR